MGLLNEYVEININGTNAKYYEDLGYEIPRYFDKNSWRWCVKRGTTIVVKVTDLSKGSNAFVDCDCDFCKKLLAMKYCDYYRNNHDGKTYCQSCAGKMKQKPKRKETPDDMIGKQFGFWTIKSRAENDASNHICYNCTCICGKEDIVRKTVLKNEKSKSCGCNGCRQVKGKRFNRLVCLTDAYSKEDGRLYVMVKCDCETEKEMLLQSLNSGLVYSCGCYIQEIIKSRVGENHPNWNPNLTDEDRRKQHSRASLIGYGKVKSTTLKRDNNTCQCCGFQREKDMRVHHINSWNIDEEHRMDVNNLITLCPDCHDIGNENSFHKLYGNGYNTREQLQEYFDKRRTELNLPLIKINEILARNQELSTDDSFIM